MRYKNVIARGLKPLALTMLLACGADDLSQPLPENSAEAPPLAGEISRARYPSALADAWGKALMRQRSSLASLRARHGHASSELTLAKLQRLEREIAIEIADSARQIANESKGIGIDGRRAQSTLVNDPRVSGAGIIDPSLSHTQFFLPSNPEVYAVTYPSFPAMWIRQKMTGTYTKLGQTYGINNVSEVGFQFPDVPRSPFPPFIIYPSVDGTTPLAVDCSHVGIEASATTLHEAGWSLLDWTWVVQSFTSSDTDKGGCPHVAPVAHFAMSASGRGGSDAVELELPEPAMVVLSAQGTERDAPISSYNWLLNGAPIGTGFSQGVLADMHSNGIRLTVIDQLGKSNSADGVILVKCTADELSSGPACGAAQPPSPISRAASGGTRELPGSAVPLGDGSGGYSVTVCQYSTYFQSWDGGRTWYYQYSTTDFCWTEYKW